MFTSFVAKLFEKQRTNFYYNWLSFIEDFLKSFLVCFLMGHSVYTHIRTYYTHTYIVHTYTTIQYCALISPFLHLQEVQKCTYTPQWRRCSSIAENLRVKELPKVPV